MNRKYLDDIGYTNRHDMWNPEDSRQEEWAREREIDHANACAVMRSCQIEII